MKGDSTMVKPTDNTDVLPNRYAESGKIATLAKQPTAIAFNTIQRAFLIHLGISLSLVMFL